MLSLIFSEKKKKKKKKYLESFTLKVPSKFAAHGILKLILSFLRENKTNKQFTWNVKSYFLRKNKKKKKYIYFKVSSVVVVISTLRVNQQMT